MILSKTRRPELFLNIVKPAIILHQKMEREMNFDIKPVKRKGTGSIKWDFSKEYAGYDNLIPLWVADMDFEVPEAVTESIIKRAEHKVYGYSGREDDYYSSVASWFNKRHNWQIAKELIRFSPGVIPALNACVQAFTEPGDGIIVQTPVYYPFMTAVTNNKRELKVNQLKETDGIYSIDFDHFESLIDEKTRMFILCNPHNPVGRVWNREELVKLADICLKHRIVVIADEIHCDLIPAPAEYIPFATVRDGLEEITITCTSPSKTFNLAGLQISNIVFENREMFETFDQRMFANGLHLTNSFGIEATIAAYNDSEPWLDNLLVYIKNNYNIMRDYISENIPVIGVTPLEGTYLGWLDFRSFDLKEEEVSRKLMEEAGVWLEKGSVFGPGGEGFQRINLGAGEETLRTALEKISKVF